VKNAKKNSTHVFRNSKKTVPKIKTQKKGNQALAVYPNLVRTHFEALWKRNERVALV
jgi:hypothetical protein